MFYEEVYLSFSSLSIPATLFIPISKSVSDLDLTNMDTEIFTFLAGDFDDTKKAEDKTEESPPQGLKRLFDMISKSGGDGHSYANGIFQSYFSGRPKY